VRASFDRLLHLTPAKELGNALFMKRSVACNTYKMVRYWWYQSWYQEADDFMWKNKVKCVK